MIGYWGVLADNRALIEYKVHMFNIFCQVPISIRFASCHKKVAKEKFVAENKSMLLEETNR